MFEIAFAWRGRRIGGSNSGCNRVLSQLDEHQLARMHSGGLESTQTRVGRGFWLEAISRLTVTRGRLKIAEVASRIEDVSAFTSAINAFGFYLDSKVRPACLCKCWSNSRSHFHLQDDRNTHFLLFEFIKHEKYHLMTGDKLETLLAAGSVLKPCEYKRR